MSRLVFVCSIVLVSAVGHAFAQAPVDPYADDQGYAVDTTASDYYANTDPSALTDFRGALDPYGAWIEDPTYGTIWVPSTNVVGAGFEPYQSSGHWAYDGNDYVWESDYPFGWVVFHYGRWVSIPGLGWAWVPGRTYAPAWVDWRVGYDNYDYVGWAPMGPDWGWFGGAAIGLGFLPAATFVYVPTTYIFAPHVHRHFVHGNRYRDIERHTRVYAHESTAARGAYTPAYRRGPDPRAIGVTHVVKAPANDKGLTRARQYARASTAVPLGASRPARNVEKPRPRTNETGQPNRQGRNAPPTSREQTKPRETPSKPKTPSTRGTESKRPPEAGREPTTKPETTRQPRETTTKQHGATTTKPREPTTKPETTRQPRETTTKQHGATTTKPRETTKPSHETTTKPSRETTPTEHGREPRETTTTKSRETTTTKSRETTQQPQPTREPRETTPPRSEPSHGKPPTSAPRETVPGSHPPRSTGPSMSEPRSTRPEPRAAPPPPEHRAAPPPPEHRAAPTPAPTPRAAPPPPPPRAEAPPPMPRAAPPPPPPRAAAPPPMPRAAPPPPPPRAEAPRAAPPPPPPRAAPPPPAPHAAPPPAAHGHHR